MTDPDSAAQWKFYDPTSSSTYTVAASDSNSDTDSYDLSVTSGAFTDWWTTAPGSQPESSAHRSSGPIIYQPLHLAPSQNWKLSATVIQQGQERFQQTTLFVQRINKGEGEGKGAEGQKDQLWLKSGIEIEAGRKYVGVVATNPYSDWNVSPLLPPAPPSASASADAVHIEIEKTGPDVHVYYTYPDSNERFLLREKKGFALPLNGNADKEDKEVWWIGAMVCGPKSEKTTGTVEGWKFQLL